MEIRSEAFTADPGLWQRVIAPEDRKIWDEAVAQVSGGDARIFDLHVVHQNGRTATLSQSLYSVRGAGGYQMFGVTPGPIFDPGQELPDFADFMVFFAAYRTS